MFLQTRECAHERIERGGREQWKCQHLVAHLSKVTRSANIINVNVRREERQTAGGPRHLQNLQTESGEGKKGGKGGKDPKCRNKLICKSKGAEIERNEAPSRFPCCATAMQGGLSLTKLGWVVVDFEHKTACLS